MYKLRHRNEKENTAYNRLLRHLFPPGIF
ncbi:MAG: hypothetical protein PWQ65_838, partial [Bacteroidota bacterium]|nr:hypothetical protein [Bacteroidota bacterium]